MVNSYLVKKLQPLAQKKQDKASLATPEIKAELNKQSDYILKIVNTLNK
jgi:aminopeptidase N